MSNVNGSFLDKNGLTYLWGKLKAIFTTIDGVYGLGTEIPASSNLDQYTITGTFYGTSGNAGSITNKPVTSGAFHLYVFKTSGSTYIQIYKQLTTDGDSTFYVRRYYSTWQPWHTFSDDDAIMSMVMTDVFMSPTALSAGDNLNSITIPGRYYSGSSTISGNITNSPYTGGGYLLVVEIINENVTQTVYANVATPNRFWRRVNISGTWNDWYQFGSFGAIGDSLANGTDILSLNTGRYYKSSSATTLVNLPSDWGSVGACFIEVSAATNVSRRHIRLYPAVKGYTGYYYERTQYLDGGSASWGTCWYKYTGTAVND